MISIDITSEPFHVCSIQYMFTIWKRKKQIRQRSNFL
jgi:hypothetical protein